MYFENKLLQLKVIGNTEFYKESLEINKKNVLALIKNKSKFTLNNREARKILDYKYERLNKKLQMNCIR